MKSESEGKDQVFSGKKEDFPSFLAKLPKDSSVVLDESKEAEAKQIEAKKKNMTAMSYLTFAMSTPQLLAKIEASKSTMAWWFSV